MLHITNLQIRLRLNLKSQKIETKFGFIILYNEMFIENTSRSLKARSISFATFDIFVETSQFDLKNSSSRQLCVCVCARVCVRVCVCVRVEEGKKI